MLLPNPFPRPFARPVNALCLSQFCLPVSFWILRREPFETRKATLASLLRGSLPGLRLNDHLTHPGDVVFRHACKMGLEGIVSKRLGSRYRSGRSKDWLKFKNPDAPAVKREAEEEWDKER